MITTRVPTAPVEPPRPAGKALVTRVPVEASEGPADAKAPALDDPLAGPPNAMGLLRYANYVPIVGGLIQGWWGYKELQAAHAAEKRSNRASGKPDVHSKKGLSNPINLAKLNGVADMGLGVAASGYYGGSFPAFFHAVKYSATVARFANRISSGCNWAFLAIDGGRDVINAVVDKDPIQAVYAAAKTGAVALGSWGALHECGAALWGCEALYLGTVLIQQRANVMAGVRDGSAFARRVSSRLIDRVGGWKNQVRATVTPGRR